MLSNFPLYYRTMNVHELNNPVLVSINPTSGSTAGGTAVTVTGAGFKPGIIITLGGVELTDVTVVDSGQVTGTTGANTAGAKAMSARNANGDTGPGIANAFTYV